MTRDLVPLTSVNTLPSSATEAVRDYIAASQAENTRKAYAADWQDFEQWCTTHHRASLPADPLTIAAYLAELARAGRKVSTIKRRAAAIGHHHKSAGHENPVAHSGVAATIAGIARERGSAPAKKAALTAELLAKAVRKLPADVPGLRDRALLLLGFAGAFRRAELVALDVADVARHPKGAVIRLARSKTDQAGKGRNKYIPHGKKLHAIQALDDYLIAARIVSGPIFRPTRGDNVFERRLGAREVARIVQRRAAAIGLDPKAFGGHSLRSGFITSADDAGASLKAIAEHAGHAKVETTAGYVQSEAFRNHPGQKFL